MFFHTKHHKTGAGRTLQHFLNFLLSDKKIMGKPVFLLFYL